jgi:hypothetical protein
VDRIRRYCGLSWSGGYGETWAWPYYDAVPTSHDDRVGPIDVVCVAALHPGLGKADLTFFRERRDDVSEWLAALPPDARLWEVDDHLAVHVAGLADRFPEVAISLLSKVLHRKRPHLIPLLDRHVVDWYRPITRRRAMADAWPAIARAMREEQKDPEWRFVTTMALQPIEQDLQQLTGSGNGQQLSFLRAVDIAIWMGSHPRAPSQLGARTSGVQR